MKKLLIFAAAIWMLQACTYKVHVQFNNNYSGRVTQDVDFGEMMEMMSSMGQPMTLDSILNPQQMDSMLQSLNSIEGITEASITPMNGRGYSIRYAFADLDALNRAFANSQENGLTGGEMNTYQFARKGKKLTVDLPFTGDLGDSVDDYASMIASQFFYSLTLEVPGTVRKVNYATADIEGNTVTLDEKDFDLFAKEAPTPLQVKVK